MKRQTIDRLAARRNLETLFHCATIEQYHAGKNWYQDAFRDCETYARLFSTEPYIVAGILAVTSPGQNWDLQIAHAGVLLDSIKRNSEHIAGFGYGLNKEKARTLFHAWDETLITGPKVSCFFRNIVGADMHNATIDRHMIRAAFDVSNPIAIARLAQRVETIPALQNIIADQAAQHNMLPMQYQAIVWTVVRDL